MCLLLAIGFASALSPGKSRSGASGNKNSFRSRLSQWLSREQLVNKRIFVVFVGVAVGIGLIFSASRGGMIAILAALLTLGLLFTMRRKRPRKGRTVLILLLLILTYAINIGVDYPLSRFKSIDASYLGRMQYWQNNLKIVDDYRLFGAGVGSFPHIYSGYQAVEDKGSSPRYAHND